MVVNLSENELWYVFQYAYDAHLHGCRWAMQHQDEMRVVYGKLLETGTALDVDMPVEFWLEVVAHVPQMLMIGVDREAGRKILKKVMAAILAEGRVEAREVPRDFYVDGLNLDPDSGVPV